MRPGPATLGRWLRVGRRAARPLALLALAALAGCNAAIVALGLAWSGLDSPRPTPLLEDRRGAFLSEDNREGEPLGYWEIEGPVNPWLELCLMGTEDRRFRRHPGVDPSAVLRALANNASGGRRQGASTIAMQVARMQHPAERSWPAKLAEAAAACFMVARHGHEALWRHYLKLVPQGNQAHGVAYAARRYFGKHQIDLSLAECALLSALPQAPGRMNLFAWGGMDRARARARLILDGLRRDGRIDSEAYLAACRQLAALQPLARDERPAGCYHYILRVLDDERSRPARNYGRALRCTLDLQVQALVDQTAAGAMAEQRGREADNLALVVADRASGEVLGYCGSRYYFDQAHAGGIDYAQTPRSSGSAVKPLLFAYGLDRGLTPATVLADLPFALLNLNGEYRVANFDDDFMGPMIYRRALANSRNVPALRVLERVGLRDFYDRLARIGLLRDGRRGPEYYGYGLAIGGVYVTLGDLVAAYGSLANDGRAYRLGWVRPGQGQAAPAPADPWFSAYAARSVTLFLSDDEARVPSFPRRSPLEYNFPVAVKTGTSQGYRDAWCVAWSSKYLVGMWMGNPDNRAMNHVAGVNCAVYVHRLLAALQPDQERGVDTTAFPSPEGCVAQSVCLLSGKPAGPDCPNRQSEWFRPAELPAGECTVHRRLAVDRRTGRPAGPDTPPRQVELRPFAILPPEYAVWGSRHGFADLPVLPPQAQGPAALKLVYPLDGGRFLLDPDLPPDQQTIPLQATVSPRQARLLWEVDGRPFAEVAYPYAARWPLKAGVHRLRALLPDGGGASPTATITVR